jgi:hypothetical protein
MTESALRRRRGCCWMPARCLPACSLDGPGLKWAARAGRSTAMSHSPSSESIGSDLHYSSMMLRMDVGRPASVVPLLTRPFECPEKGHATIEHKYS